MTLSNPFRKQVHASRAEAEKDQVVVPTTMEEYCMKPKSASARPNSSQDNIEMDEFYDDDCYDMDDDDDDDEEEEDAEYQQVRTKGCVIS